MILSWVGLCLWRKPRGMFKADPWILLLRASLSKPQISQPASQIFTFTEVEQYALWATWETSSLFFFYFLLSPLLHLSPWCCSSLLVYCHLEHKAIYRKWNNLVFGPAMTQADRAKLNGPLNKWESKTVFLSNRDGSPDYGDYCQWGSMSTLSTSLA